MAFKKIPDTPTKTHLKPSPVSERSAYPYKSTVCSPLGQRVLATNLLPLTGPGLRPTVQHSSQYENGWRLECRKVNFIEYLGQGTLGCNSLSSLFFMRFSSPTNIHTHSTNLVALNQHITTVNRLYQLFRGFLQSTVWPHQSTARPLERAASHIKVTRPPCLFQLPPWENANRSTTVIYCM